MEGFWQDELHNQDEHQLPSLKNLQHAPPYCAFFCFKPLRTFLLCAIMWV